MPIPFAILQVTAAYSNAVLVAIMPQVSDFAKKLELPIAQPLSLSQVQRFGCSPRSDHIGGRVVLTNSYSFTYDAGQIILFSSPKSYYSLQDPSRIPEFYGPINLETSNAIEVARNALKTLGYTNTELHFDLPPQVRPPVKNNGHYVARYLIEWRDPNQADHGKFGVYHDLAKAEIDATSGQVQLLAISATRRPDPKIDATAPVAELPPRSQPIGGTQTYGVSPAYAHEFLTAILPELSDFIKKAGLNVPIPITTNDVDLAHYDCRWDATKTVAAFVYLKTNDRFVYRHGQVIEFDAADADRWIAPNSPFEDKPPEKFYGSVKISPTQAMATVRQAIDQLGWSAKVPKLKRSPEIVPPRKDGTNWYARYFFNWWPDDEGMQLAVGELDATSGKIKSIGINDRVNTGIWCEPPKIDVPMDVDTPASPLPQTDHRPPPSLPLINNAH